MAEEGLVDFHVTDSYQDYPQSHGIVDELIQAGSVGSFYWARWMEGLGFMTRIRVSDGFEVRGRDSFYVRARRPRTSARTRSGCRACLATRCLLLLCTIALGACRSPAPVLSSAPGAPVGSLIVGRADAHSLLSIGLAGQTPLDVAYEPGASWSPDGQSIAHIADGSSRIFVSDPAGNDPHTIVGAGSGGIFLGSSAWSPDGQQLALLCARCVPDASDTDFVPVIVDVATGVIRPVSGPPAGASFDDIDWGGPWLALYGRGGFWIGPVTGGDFRRIATTAFDARWDLSPSGDAIAVEGSGGECAARAIQIVSVPSGVTSTLVGGPDYHADPVWSPDSDWIAFIFMPAGNVTAPDCSASDPAAEEIRIVARSGGSQRTIYRGAAGPVAWLPGG